MTCRLGECTADSYRVVVRDRTGAEIVELSDYTDLTWDRRLDDISQAQVTLPANSSCCGKLANVYPWRHEIAISRDSDEVWVGPIRQIGDCTSGMIIKATDVLGWLERRVIHNDHDWTVALLGAVQAAEELVIDGFAPDDPDVLKWLTTYGTGVIGGRSYLANSKYVYDALKDLAQGSLDFTTIGRRIVLMESGYELSRTTLLTCDHFQGDVCTAVDGDDAATRTIVTGTGVTGTAGGVDPYFGLVELLVDDDRIGRQATADDQAAGLLEGRNPPPLLVQPPQGAGLAPDAPLCLADLVPGVTVPVSVNCTCRPALQDMRLTQLSVTVNDSGETIAPTLAPLGYSGSTGGTD